MTDTHLPGRTPLDPTRLKGLGHPLRVQLLDQLHLFGPATASMLAERLGESSGSTSYHLRQLARHAFVEEDAGRGQGRERWWRRTPEALIVAPPEGNDPVAREATHLIIRQVAAQRAAQLDTFLAQSGDSFEDPWVEATMLASTRLHLTVEEAQGLAGALADLFEEYVGKYRGREDVPGGRSVLMDLRAFPLVQLGDAT